MDDLSFSFIIPVYNRPEEIQELLASMAALEFDRPFEIVIVEDGSDKDAEAVVKEFSGPLKISYYKKKNTGPGDSRNYGMRKAQGNYFIVLDSDCLLPSHYLRAVKKELTQNFVHCFGGPDAAHESFSDVQKAIDFVMTSFLTTGGIRGNKRSIDRFQPRSFNMGISKEAFEKTAGFGQIHPGEDPDLTFRIWKAGYETRLFPDAFVYHKRRIDWRKFHTQVKKFGMVRPILNKWHPGTAKPTYWFPTIFSSGLLCSLVLLLLGILWPILLYGTYIMLVFLSALLLRGNLKVAFLSVYALFIQFFGYGLGFLKSTILVNFSNKEPERIFPKLFFKKV
jgi:glycosyltransferase involved in cell wall biosynthesis